MSPFADELRQLRFAHGLRQQQLADLMGCERSYVSALENDVKSAPPAEFVGRLAAKLDLSPEAMARLDASRVKSQRRYTVPADVPPSTFEIVYELFARLGELNELQVKGLSAVLQLGDAKSKPTATDGRLRRSDRQVPREGTLA